MSKDFEKVSGRREYHYNPEGDMSKEQIRDSITTYYGPVMAPAVVEELKAWGTILMALKDGIPKPFDNSIIIDKIIKLENRTGEDLSALKQCCPPSSDVREAKELKPFIFGILDRIVDVSGIQNYVERYG